MGRAKHDREPSGIRIKQLKIHEFRMVEPGTELEFSDGMNLLIGKNATGKTTLLDLISMALRLDFDDIGKEPFKVEFRLVCGEATVEVTVENKKGKGFWRKYQKGRWALQAQARCFGAGEKEKKFEADGSSKNAWDDFLLDVEEFLATGLLESEHRANPDDIESILDDLDEAWDDRVRFDEALEFFRLIIADDNDYHDVAECSLEGWRTFIPAELFREFEKKFRTVEDTSLTLGQANLPFLADAARVLGVPSMRVRGEVTGQDKKGNALFGNLRFWARSGESWIPLETLSFGQRRMFALLYYFSLNKAVAIVDEPTNGFHHEWIEDVVERLKERQSFVATQNPLILDELTFDSVENVRSTFIQCRTTEHDGKPAWQWSSLSEQEARRFYDAYKIGIQFVSEILAAKGLW